MNAGSVVRLQTAQKAVMAGLLSIDVPNATEYLPSYILIPSVSASCSL
jgi:hypothetical protein